jgi:hypothetical protein
LSVVEVDEAMKIYYDDSTDFTSVKESYSAMVEELYPGHVVSTDLSFELDEHNRPDKGK